MKHLITLLLLLNLANFATAQGKPDSIYSEVLQEKRLLNVILPPEYKPGLKEKYDVVYILDEGNIEIFSQVHRYTKGMGFIPEVIVVGVINVDRTRDFTPTVMKRMPESGGADKFISFFKQELIPYINKTYPTNGQNILYGHSLGGLFAIYTMLKDPTIFSTYLAAEPSLWYDSQYTNKLAIEKLTTFSQPDQNLFISSTKENIKMMGISTMDSILEITPLNNLTHKTVIYENEHHGSVHLKTMYEGLKFVYDGYNLQGKNIDHHPMNGIVLKNKPYTIQVNTSFPEFRYTTNGIEPTSASPKIEKVNSFTGPMKLIIKSFSEGKYEKTVTGNFVLEKPPVPVAKPKGYISGGLSYTYYEGAWKILPEFKTLKPIKSGIAGKDFNLTKLPSKNHFGLVLEGMLEIQKEGYYVLSIASDDGSKLYFSDKLIIDNDGFHGSQSSHSFLMPLKKGFYPVKLEYFQSTGGADIKLKYILPGESKPVDIPLDRLYNAPH
ncbi:MAG TPA: alpha/beta hydrolase-fold protein [Pedobacter sp.]|jgi:predicted alpha/beta superfamily hydrolase